MCKEVKKKKRLRQLDKDDKEMAGSSDDDELEANAKDLDSDGNKLSGEKVSHCHCSLFKVDEELFASMCDGQPYRRFKADIDRKAKDRKDRQQIQVQFADTVENKRKADLKVELQRMRRKLREDAKDKQKQPVSKPLSDAEVKEKRMKRKQELQDQREAKRQECFLALSM